MGPKQSTETNTSPINKKDFIEKITKSSFEYISIIGKEGLESLLSKTKGSIRIKRNVQSKNN